MNILRSLTVDSVFEVWTNGFAYHNVAVLVCVAQGGFHSISKYQWYYNGSVMEEECYPVIYMSKCGKYRCEVRLDSTVDAINGSEFNFSVEGMTKYACNMP